MPTTVTLSQSAYKELITRLSRLEKIVAHLIEKEPQEGTEEWWKYADEKGRDAIKKGQYTTLKSQKDIDNFFENL